MENFEDNLKKFLESSEIDLNSKHDVEEKINIFIQKQKEVFEQSKNDKVGKLIAEKKYSKKEINTYKVKTDEYIRKVIEFLQGTKIKILENIVSPTKTSPTKTSPTKTSPTKTSPTMSPTKIQTSSENQKENQKEKQTDTNDPLREMFISEENKEEHVGLSLEDIYNHLIQKLTNEYNMNVEKKLNEMTEKGYSKKQMIKYNSIAKKHLESILKNAREVKRNLLKERLQEKKYQQKLERVVVGKKKKNVLSSDEEYEDQHNIEIREIYNKKIGNRIIRVQKEKKDALQELLESYDNHNFAQHFFSGVKQKKTGVNPICLGNVGNSILNLNQKSVYILSKLRAMDKIHTSGLLVNQGTGAGKTLIAVCIMLSFWNKYWGNDKLYAIFLVSTRKNQLVDNNIIKLAQLCRIYFPTFVDHTISKENGQYIFSIEYFNENKGDFTDHDEFIAKLLMNRFKKGIFDSFITEETNENREYIEKYKARRLEEGSIGLSLFGKLGYDLSELFYDYDIQTFRQEYLSIQQQIEKEREENVSVYNDIVRNIFSKNVYKVYFLSSEKNEEFYIDIQDNTLYIVELYSRMVFTREYDNKMENIKNFVDFVSDSLGRNKTIKKMYHNNNKIFRKGGFYEQASDELIYQCNEIIKSYKHDQQHYNTKQNIMTGCVPKIVFESRAKNACSEKEFIQIPDVTVENALDVFKLITQIIMGYQQVDVKNKHQMANLKTAYHNYILKKYNIYAHEERNKETVYEQKHVEIIDSDVNSDDDVHSDEIQETTNVIDDIYDLFNDTSEIKIIQTNEHRQMQHCVFILDEVQFLFDPPASEASMRKNYRFLLHALTYYRDPNTTWVVGLTATPGSSEKDVSELLSMLLSCEDHWISKENVEIVRNPEFENITNVYRGKTHETLQLKTPGVVRYENKTYEFYEKVSPHIRIRNQLPIRSEGYLLNDMEKLKNTLHYMISFADFSGDLTLYPSVHIQRVCIPHSEDFSALSIEVQKKIKDKEQENENTYLELQGKEFVHKRNGKIVRLPKRKILSSYRRMNMYILESSLKNNFGVKNSSVFNKNENENGQDLESSLKNNFGVKNSSVFNKNENENRQDLESSLKNNFGVKNSSVSNENENENGQDLEPINVKQKNGDFVLTPSKKIQHVLKNILSHQNGKHYVYCSDLIGLLTIAYYLTKHKFIPYKGQSYDEMLLNKSKGYKYMYFTDLKTSSREPFVNVGPIVEGTNEIIEIAEYVKTNEKHTFRWKEDGVLFNVDIDKVRLNTNQNDPYYFTRKLTYNDIKKRGFGYASSKVKNKNGDHYNLHGEVIPVILALGESFKGVDMSAIRYIHCVDSFTDLQDFLQLLGRAPRMCSHALLPPSARNVKMFIYHSYFENMIISSNKINSDIYLWEQSVKKYKELWKDINQFFLQNAYDHQVFKNINERVIERIERILTIECNSSSDNDKHADDKHADDKHADVEKHSDVEKHVNILDEIEKRINHFYDSKKGGKYFKRVFPDRQKNVFYKVVQNQNKNMYLFKFLNGLSQIKIGFEDKGTIKHRTEFLRNFTRMMENYDLYLYSVQKKNPDEKLLQIQNTLQDEYERIQSVLSRRKSPTKNLVDKSVKHI